MIRRNSNFNDIVGLIILEPVERETLRTWIPGAEAEENTWMFGAVVDPTYMGMGVATVSTVSECILARSFFPNHVLARARECCTTVPYH